MKISSKLLQAGALCVAVLFLVAGRGDAHAQSSNAIALPLPEQLTESEQLKAQNIRLQAQLREAELAIERNRAEAQEAARAQAAAITEKLNTIQAALEVERKRQQDELARQREDLSRQRDDLQTSDCHQVNALLGIMQAGDGGMGKLRTQMVPGCDLELPQNMASRHFALPDFQIGASPPGARVDKATLVWLNLRPSW